MKLNKNMEAKDAGLEWKRLCDLAKNPTLAVAAIGHDPFVYEGESLLDSGACEHICGLGLLSSCQKAVIFNVPEKMSFATAGGLRSTQTKTRMFIPALGAELEFWILPQNKTMLISVGKLVEDGWAFTFSDSECKLVHQNGTIVECNALSLIHI